MLGSACSQASHVAQVKEAGEEREAIAHISSTAANKVTMWTEGDIRYIRANGVPDHAHGQFPNAGNPNQITAQDYTFAMTLNPSLASTTTERGGIFGIALNGVPFDPGTAEYWNNGQRTHQRSDWRYEALSGHLDLGLDNNNAHVQPTGAYHYHGIPTGLVELLNGEQFTGLVGYAADGFPIYVVSTVSPSYRIKSGQRSSGPGGTYDGTFVADYEYVEGLGDLDECNGRVGTTPDYPNGTYHYYLTSTFPFIPRCWKGSPDDSFARSAPESGQHPGGQPGAGRPRQRTGLPPFPPHRRPNHR
ncbi:MAG: YHYH protein [Cyanobacteria bacterium P01_F01_bin.150]